MSNADFMSATKPLISAGNCCKIISIILRQENCCAEREIGKPTGIHPAQRGMRDRDRERTVNSFTMAGAKEGLTFYLKPDIDKMGRSA